MNVKTLLIALFFLLSEQLYAQSGDCEMVYRRVDIKAKYKSGKVALSKFIMYKIAPVIASDSAGTKPVISSLHTVLTISKRGKVVDAGLIDFPGSPEVEKELKTTLLAMPSWLPAKVNGKPVCSVYYWPITCFLWEIQ